MFEYIYDIALFDPAQFHFLRPEWLWAFIPMAAVALLILITSREDNKWKKVIAPALRGFMFTKEKRSSLTFPLIMFILIISIGILALSGPAWSKEEVPGAKSEAVLMIALDCSMSMLAEDIQPNRLERGKFKIRDLLSARPGASISLYAFAGTAHTVVPTSSDYRIIEHHLMPLTPGIMPVQGTNLEMMMEMADSSLGKIEAPSTLLLVTDALEEEQITILENFVDNTPHRIEILAMASSQGASIPKNERKQPLTDADGNIVISRLDPDILFRLQKHDKINVNTLTLDNSDVELIAEGIRKNLTFQAEDEKSEEQWKDMGFVLLILLALLIPFWYRKGWMIRYSWIPLAFVMSSCSGDINWNDLWYSKDYQAQRLYDQGSYENAGDTYESPVHQGVAYYKAGNYDAAAQAFAKDSSANSLYNLGLAYTRMGNYEEALEVIQLASEKDPDNETFKQAIGETIKTLGIVDSLRKEGIAIELPEEEEKEAGILEERRAKGKDEELTSDTEVDELPQDGKRVTDEVETDMRKAEEMDEVPDNFESGSGQTPQNVLLRGISESPAEFLKRRFKYQHNKYHKSLKELPEKW